MRNLKLPQQIARTEDNTAIVRSGNDDLIVRRRERKTLRLALFHSQKNCRRTGRGAWGNLQPQLRPLLDLLHQHLRRFFLRSRCRGRQDHNGILKMSAPKRGHTQRCDTGQFQFTHVRFMINVQWDKHEFAV